MLAVTSSRGEYTVETGACGRQIGRVLLRKHPDEKWTSPVLVPFVKQRSAFELHDVLRMHGSSMGSVTALIFLRGISDYRLP